MVLNFVPSKYFNVEVTPLAKLVAFNKPNSSNHTPLYYAITRLLETEVKELISVGANVNAEIGLLCQSPLIFTLAQNNQDMAFLLLQSKKIDIKKKDIAG